ncbi:MAG: ABC transporter permease [Butyrivibrio sp.]|nr:ABC transporter permease [Butyrivibrio sp.]
MNFKKFFSNKKRNIIFIILAALLLLDLILGLICRHIINGLDDQQAARRWETDGRAAQVSLFYTEDQMITYESIRKLEYNMEKKMQDAGIIEEEDDDNSSSVKIVDTRPVGRKEASGSDSNNGEEPKQEEPKIYNSSYSAQGICSLEFESRNAENVDAMGVGGDFFLFHPMELVSGGYFWGDDLMKDKIVIDEYLAWQVFGSSDIIGQCVTIGGVNHYIAGVVKSPTGRFNKAAGLSRCIVYMSYDSLARYGTILSGRTSEQEISEDGAKMQSGGINCYEVVMPDPVEGIAARIVKESSGLEDKYISVVDNTNRFNGFALFNVIRGFGIRSMWTQPIFYPYWENVARGFEDVLGLMFLFRIICKVAFWLIVAVLVIIAYRNKTWTVKGIMMDLADRKYEFEARRRLKKETLPEITDKDQE